MKQKRPPEKPTLYKCYQWYLDNVSDEKLRIRECDIFMIETMYQIHEYITSYRKDRRVIKSGKITSTEIRKFERLYKGENQSTQTRIAQAFQYILQGESDAYMRDAGISHVEIRKAKEFRDKYAQRDMFPKVLAQKLDISASAAKRMQDIYQALNPFNLFL